VLSNNDFSFQAGSQSGPSLAVELIGPHVRLGGRVRLGAYVRLSDLLNLHDVTLAVAEAVVLNRTGRETADSVPTLDVRLDAISLVIDHSGYISPAAPEDVGIQKTSHRLMAVTEAHLITATFFIYPGAEPATYLLAAEPRWIPLTNVRVRSLIDRRIKFGAMFAVLNRAGVRATTVL
jgi:hypothetical protein